MTELEARLSDARTRLTELQQEARAGRRLQALLGLSALTSELISYVLEQTAEQFRAIPSGRSHREAAAPATQGQQRRGDAAKAQAP